MPRRYYYGYVRSNQKAFYSCEATSQAGMLVWTFGDSREGQIPRSLLRQDYTAGSDILNVIVFHHLNPALMPLRLFIIIYSD